MLEWKFAPPPGAGHYVAVPDGPHICVFADVTGELCLSLWRKTANEQHYCHVLYDATVVEHPLPEHPTDLEDGHHPGMQLVPVSVEDFHRLKMAARHIRSKEAWDRLAHRYAMRNCQMI